MIKKFLKFYGIIFNFLAKNREISNDLPLWHIHCHNISVITTGILMWAYAIIAAAFIESPIPGKVGFICAILHLLSPLLFRFTSNVLFVASFMLLTGVIHQGTFAYFTGGYTSNILIWYGIIPMLGGIIAGKKGAILWSAIVIIISIIFLSLKLVGHQFPNNITEIGALLSHTLLIFGWILTTTSVLYIFNTLTENNEEVLRKKNEKIDNLLKILLHDMSNSIHVLKGTLSLVTTKNLTEESKTSKLKGLRRHTNFLSDTISSIESMYVIDSSQNEIQLQELEVNKSMRMILSILDHKVQEKSIQINYNFEANSNKYIFAAPHIFENQILQNIITNAIKFSHPNGTIDITTNTHSIDPNYLEIRIKDYGIGMDLKLKKNLFNPNFKTSRPGTSNEPGTGLGMIIVKNFTEKMHGELSINSVLNEGTEIILKMQKA